MRAISLDVRAGRREIPDSLCLEQSCGGAELPIWAPTSTVNAACEGIIRIRMPGRHGDANGLRSGRIPVRRRHSPRTERGPDREQRRRRTGERAGGERDERRDVRRERSGRGRVRGDVQRRRAGRAEHGAGRRRRALQERRSDDGRAARRSSTCSRARSRRAWTCRSTRRG